MLELVDVVPGVDPDRQPVSVSLPAGQWQFQHEPLPERFALWLDVLTGLRLPVRGEVCFRGICWSDHAESAARRARRRIGCIQSPTPWIRQKPMSENILLTALFDGRAPQHAYIDKAEKLCIDFGLPGVPLSLPAELGALDCLRCACVRAFLHNPQLVVIADTGSAEWQEILPPLMNRLLNHCFNGGSVFWISHERDCPER